MSDLEVGFCPRCGTHLEPRFLEDRFRPTCPSCGLVYYHDPKVAVAVVIGDERGLLLGRRNIDPAKGGWSFPAGYVNRGEVLEEAAVREAREEMGVSVELHGLVGVYSRRGEPVVLVVYAGSIAAGSVAPDGREVSEARLFALDALPPMAFGHDDQIVADWRARFAPGEAPSPL